MRDRALTALVGLVFGFSLHRIGFSSWDQVHRMFTFADARLLFGFALAVALMAPAWALIRLRSNPRWSPRRLHPGTIPGGILFGLGWALSGACPSIALVQLGAGHLSAGWTLFGILVGNALYAPIHARMFRWSSGSCIDD